MIFSSSAEYPNLVSAGVSGNIHWSICSGPLYLNRQIIVLLSHRSIDDRTFLLLANEHQQILSESLVYPKRAYELLAEKINRSLFPLRALINDAHLNLIQEPFFRQLLITTGKFELMQMRERTRLKLPRNSARNMIGIVDEYGILEYGQGNLLMQHFQNVTSALLSRSLHSIYGINWWIHQ